MPEQAANNFLRERLLVIHNPMAGINRRGMLRDVCHAMKDAGATVHVIEAEDLKVSSEIAAETVACNGYDGVVAAGGDSTVRGVASGLAGSNLPLGLIPVGTGNVLAHEIGCRRNAARIAELLMTGPDIAIRGGLANNEPFYLMAGAGVDARILGRLNQRLKRRIGKLAYAGPLIREFARKVERFDVLVDGLNYRCNWMITTRISRYGGSCVIAPEQNLGTDRLQAFLVNATDRVELMSVFCAALRGRLERHPCVTARLCQKIEIPAGQGIAVQIDGEPIGTDVATGAVDSLNISLASQSVQLIVSPEYAASCIAEAPAKAA